MSKDKLTDYSSTAGSNTDIGGINIDEGMLPSNVNNAMREQMSHLADFAAGTTGINVLNLQDDDASASIKIQAPAAVTTTTTLTLPDGAGSANQSLTTNGSGTLSWSTRIGNVVEDTTPQLGGNLDTNGNDITFGDNDKAIFGAGSDLQIYHDSGNSNSYIYEGGIGSLYIGNNGVEIGLLGASNTEYLAKFVTNGQVELMFDNAIRLATTATGVDVTGTVTADGLTLGDNEKAIFGAGSDFEIFHDGSNTYLAESGGVGNVYLRANNLVLLNNANENYVECVSDGAVTLYHNNAPKLATTATGVNVTGTLGATTVDLGNWTITESAGVLYFATGGTNKMKIDASGNLTVVGDVTAFGSV